MPKTARDVPGKFYWHVHCPENRIYLRADRVEVVEGCLLFYCSTDDGQELIYLALAPGKWEHFYAASMLDGSPVCVDSWN